MRTKLRPDQVGRKLVQVGFLLLFFYPAAVVLFQRITYNSSPTFTSWLLPWDPGLWIARSLHQREALLAAVGAPALLLALSLIFGRFFCGWICPIGTLTDLIRAVFPQKKHKKVKQTHSRQPWLRYYILAAAVGAAIFSLRFLGILDPLVIFHRASASLANSLVVLSRSGFRAAAVFGSLLFLIILVLEVWRPRTWCRSLCPLGALLGLVSRFRLLQRLVSPELCTGCRRCERSCEMNAISESGILTDYTQCTFCLECSGECPQSGIRFGFIQTKSQPAVPAVKSIEITALQTAPTLPRRKFLGLMAAGLAGAALPSASALIANQPVLRPPGSLPEDQFLSTCVLCQECVRVCPTGALRPALLESGLGGIGTPILVPRSGGCALNPSCPNLCAQVCPVGAIQPSTKETMKIGLARVHREACLAWDQGSKCLVCVEACLNSAAIAYNGRVTVDPNHCTGCGRCESGCPVPGSAIRVEPL